MIETGLDDLLGGLATVYPVNRPLKGDLPCITWRRISTLRDQTHDGPSNLISQRFQLTIHADTQLAADTLAGQVADLLDGHAAPIGTANVSNTEVVNQTDLGYIDNTKTHQVAVDAIFHIER